MEADDSISVLAFMPSSPDLLRDAFLLANKMHFSVSRRSDQISSTSVVVFLIHLTIRHFFNNREGYRSGCLLIPLGWKKTNSSTE